MAGDTDAGIVRENALDACGHFLCAIRDEHLPGVLRVADAYATAVVNRNPACAACCVEQCIEQRPIGDGVGSIAHFFRLAVGRSNGAAIEMVAANDDGRFQFTARDEVVDCEAEFVAFAIAEPANARGKSLETDSFLRQLDPAAENFVVRKHFEDKLVRTMDIRRLAGKRGPTERPATLAKERTNVGGNEAGKIVGVFYSLLE